MTKLELARLNRILGDSLGRNPQGDPIYKWIWSRELTFPLRSKEKTVERNGIIVFEPSYEWEPQVAGDCWLLAKWLMPEGSYDSWLTSFGSEVPFPAHGLYYVTDVMLKPGLEPNEAITYDCIGKVKHLRGLTLSEVVDAQQAKMDRNDKASETRLEDFIADKATAFGNVPGKRGGVVSFGGV